MIDVIMEIASVCPCRNKHHYRSAWLFAPIVSLLYPFVEFSPIGRIAVNYMPPNLDANRLPL